MKIIFLVGLPGSGKTYMGNDLLKRPNHQFIDDASCHSDKIYSLNYERNKTVVIADVTLCDSEIRDKAIKTLTAKFKNEELTFEWVYFENSPDKCIKNVIRRNDGRVVTGTINRYKNLYKVPEGVTAVPVWHS